MVGLYSRQFLVFADQFGKSAKKAIGIITVCKDVM